MRDKDRAFVLRMQIAQAENIYSVFLDENSTCTEYILKFLDKMQAGKDLQGSITPTSSLSAKIIRKDGTVEELGKLKVS